MARLVLQQLSKVFHGSGRPEVRAVNGVSLTVEEGEALVLVGPSGSGKTVTLRLIAGLEQPSAGTITLGGRPLNGLPAGERNIAMVFQGCGLYPHMTAGENIAFGLKVRGCPAREAEQRARQAAEMLGVDDCLESRPGELSGGQRQRVALGRALVREPALFLFDEPFASLDLPARLQLRAEVARLHRLLKWTAIYVTHDQEEAMAMGDRLAVMGEGIIHQEGAPLEIYQRPASRFVAGFIGSPPMNFLKGVIARKGANFFFKEEVADANLYAGGHEFALVEPPSPGAVPGALEQHLGQPVLMGIRPEHIQVWPWSAPAHGGGRDETTGGSEVFSATIDSIQRLGPETHLSVKWGSQTLMVRSDADFQQIGPEVRLRFNMRQVRFFDARTGKTL